MHTIFDPLSPIELYNRRDWRHQCCCSSPTRPTPIGTPVLLSACLLSPVGFETDAQR
uniref:Uncharacterized protein n=1 Tax=Arundo donax TaxID=35708 RepID=A0A0A9AET7_ARUDO